jgi:hypothetical protein
MNILKKNIKYNKNMDEDGINHNAVSYENDYNRAINTDAYSLTKLCKTNETYNLICNDDIFWKHKLEYDFQNFYRKEDLGNFLKMRYKDLYMNIYKLFTDRANIYEIDTKTFRDIYIYHGIKVKTIRNIYTYFLNKIGHNQ